MDEVRTGTAAGLLGRQPDLDTVRRLLDAGRVDGGALLLVGDPGVGKTAVLDAAATLATEDGWRVLRASGVEFLTDLTFSTLTSLLKPLEHHVDDLQAAARRSVAVVLGLTVGPVGDEMLRYNAVLSLLRAASADAPLLLLVDDVHWADRASASALGFVARRLHGTHVVLLATSRPVQGGLYGLAELAHDEVAPLPDAEAAALLRDRFPDLDGPTARRVMAEAEGNPLALLELPQALVVGPRRQRLWPESSVLPLTRRLRMLYAARIEELPAPTRELLLLAALEGTGDLGTVAAASQGADLADLGPAERSRLVVADVPLRRIAFRHPLVRATVVETASAGDRLRVHGLLAQALKDDPVRHSRHLAEASDTPDEHVAAHLEAAARLVLARGDAVGAFVGVLRAADLSPAPDARSRRLTVAAYIGVDVAGELRTAAQLLVEARRADPSVRGSLQAAVAAAFLLLNSDGDVTMAHRLLVGALRESGASGAEDAEARTHAVVTLFEICLFGARPELWSSYLEVRVGPTPSMSPATRVYVDVLGGMAGVTAPLVHEVEALVGTLHREADPTRIERVATAALFLDRAGGCRAPLARLVEDGRAGGAVTSAINAFMVLAIDAFHSGQWDECVAYCEEGTALCDDSGYQLLRWSLRHTRGLVAAARGETAEAAAVVEGLDAWSSGRGVDAVRRYARHVSELAHLGRDDAEAAFTDVVQVCPPGELPDWSPQAAWVTLDLVEAAVDTGRVQEAARHVEMLGSARLSRHAPRVRLMWAGSRAFVAGAEEASALYQEALALPGCERWPFEVARIQLRFGRHLRAGRDLPGARQQLAAALGTFRRLGAAPWEARAAHALRAAGAATGGPGTGTARLTPEELRIAALAASGLTNRQIAELTHLSHRTVGARLHQVFPKLGVTTRAALRDALSARSDD